MEIISKIEGQLITNEIQICKRAAHGPWLQMTFGRETEDGQ